MSAGLYFNKSFEVSAETMRRLRYEGLTNHQIAKRCGCSEATVYRYIGKKSLDVKNAAMTNKPSPVKEEPVFTPIIEPSATILSKSAEIISKEELPVENAAPIIKKANDRKKMSPDVIAKIYELHDQGKSSIAIGKELNISSSTVCRYVAKRGKEESSHDDTPTQVTYSKIKMKLVTTAKGEVCDYKVDLSSGSIDISGLLQGVLDRDTIDNVIDELTQIRSLVMGGN